MASDRLAVYTTVYPGVEQYLSAWYQSVLSQTDRDFDLWIGVDSLQPDAVAEAMNAKPGSLNLVSGKQGTPAKIRQWAIELLLDDYSSLIFVDSDDLLYPTRVETARKALESNDLAGCGLRIIDEGGADLGITFGQTNGEQLGTLLPRYNIFGMSNTAYRSELLRRCLPLPEGCEIVDWLLATRAWAQGASLTFDQHPQMAYRQYSANVARVLLPFTTEQVLEASRRVLTHYCCLLEAEDAVNGACGSALRSAHERAVLFYRAINESPKTLAGYVEALNQKTPRYVWWWCVAHPELENKWKH